MMRRTANAPRSRDTTGKELSFRAKHLHESFSNAPGWEPGLRPHRFAADAEDGVVDRSTSKLPTERAPITPSDSRHDCRAAIQRRDPYECSSTEKRRA